MTDWVDGFKCFEKWPAELKVKMQVIIDQMESDGDHPINEYGDNLRICRRANAEEVATYEEAQKQGCCGSFDEDYLVDEIEIRFGFNYGH